MKTISCKKCNEPFAKYVSPEGIYRVSHRVNCYNCIPYKSGKRLSLSSTPAEGQKTICSRCEKEYIYCYKKGYRGSLCLSCKSTKYHNNVKLKAVKLKGGKCKRCGYNKCLRALHFHHRNSKEKEFTICQRPYLGWGKIKEELKKCDLLCANCHAEVEDELLKSKKNLGGK